MKKAYIFLSLLVVLWSLTSCSSEASLPKNSLQFNTYNDGTAFVTGIGNYTDKKIVIPSKTPNGQTVVAIGKGAFKETDIEEVVIPESVTSIGDEAFLNCENLKSVSFSNGLEKIGNRAFANSAVESITLPDSVTQIGEEAFYNSNLTSANLGNGKTEIKSKAFAQCASLSILKLSPNTVSITKNSLRSPSIVEIFIPGTLVVVSEEMFYEFRSLKKVEIAEGVTSIEEKAFYRCEALVEVKLPYTLENIGDFAFAGCSSLNKITLNNCLKTI
ncbi:MAG: leucine-rich repeat domain-containing protein, partial [Clostridia bacterium]|nr:leucine-rich repeat domain-containing protein [Clostridia bacterium]